MKFIFSLLLISIYFNIYSQKMPSDYFKEANNLLDQKKYDEAILNYQFIVDNYINNELYPFAYYELAFIYCDQKKYDKAIPMLKEILLFDFDYSKEFPDDLHIDDYNNYKHSSAYSLSDYYYNIENFDSALHYLVLSDTVYPLETFCGNVVRKYKCSLSLTYADMYQKLNQNQKAIESLLPYVFEDYDSLVVPELKNFLKGRKNVKRELRRSVRNLYSKAKVYESYSNIIYNIYFLNCEVVCREVPSFFSDDYNIRIVKKEVRESFFYKTINTL